ncbi:unnamed protein product [Adineta steineri]|uniref:DUF7932 domain-containing protein n=2 Tax=Adineta steineri TaxID=433720 RepID=A0A813XV15_9BILA|nr:unnamed protein product [Adineta steineri]
MSIITEVGLQNFSFDVDSVSYRALKKPVDQTISINGQSGSNGYDGTSGSAGYCGSNGSNGGDGSNGSDGGNGCPGTDSQNALIWLNGTVEDLIMQVKTFNNLNYNFKLAKSNGIILMKVNGGNGGNGGSGGSGGNGGHGGDGHDGCNGSNGCNASAEGASGGDGGHGGRGGNGGCGGNGGRGGYGGDGGNAGAGGHVQVQSADPRLFMLIEMDCRAGKKGQGGCGGSGGSRGIGGSGGCGGRGGRGGSGGPGGANGIDGSHGCDGIRGTDGCAGNDGHNGRDGLAANSGSIQYAVVDIHGNIIETGSDKYHVSVYSYTIADENNDGIYEPNSIFFITNVKWINNGAMTLPSGSILSFPSTEYITTDMNDISILQGNTINQAILIMMADRDLKYLSIKSIIIIVFLIDKMSTLSHNCSTTVWASDATTIAGSPTAIAGFNSTLLYEPFGLMVGKNDSIYVMDYYTCYRMQVFYPGSQLGITIFNTTSGTDLNQLSYVTALDIDVSGNMYVLDQGNDRVIKWTPGASSGILVAGGNGQGSSLNQLDSPSDFFIEPNTSYIWIADSANNRIVKWINTSTALLVAGGTQGSKANQFHYPDGIFVDTSDSNTFYVADCNNHRIQKWLYGGSNGTTVAGQSGVYGSALNQLYLPYTLTMDRNKSLYIVDYGNNRIVLWLLGATSGIVIAGTGVSGVLPSQLYEPQSVKLDSTGALIVDDYGNNRIQRFPVLCSPNTTSSSSTTSVLTNSTPIATTSQNTTIAVPLTTKSLTTSASNPTTILSASTSIANPVTVSATVSTSTLVTTSQKSNLTNTTTKLSLNYSLATRNLNSKLLILLFCFIMIFINN